MKVKDKDYRTIWRSPDTPAVQIIDQTRLPFEFVVRDLNCVEDAAEAIQEMRVRGAPLIGATAAYGIYLAILEDSSGDCLRHAYEKLLATRPTAINLKWALDEMMSVVEAARPGDRLAVAEKRAAEICTQDIETCRSIGQHGLSLIEKIAEQKDDRINVLTHCNAGWLATVDWGTALAPVYMAWEKGIAVHVWVDETRPRNQGASLTAWELNAHGIPHTVIVDNAGGHLMQNKMVDLCIVGTDRTCANGDVCNKIGTYLKALAAFDSLVPFYVALPHSTIDWTLEDGSKVPIEERGQSEITHMNGLSEDGQVFNMQIVAPGSPATNYAFDITPARLVTGLITERGIAQASKQGLLALYPERRID